jgi:hypothetical protein
VRHHRVPTPNPDSGFLDESACGREVLTAEHLRHSSDEEIQYDNQWANRSSSIATPSSSTVLALSIPFRFLSPQHSMDERIETLKVKHPPRPWAPPTADRTSSMPPIPLPPPAPPRPGHFPFASPHHDREDLDLFLTNPTKNTPRNCQNRPSVPPKRK